MQEERTIQEARLKEIQTMTLAGLSDDAILELLAERKHLENLILQYQQEDALASESAKKHDALVAQEKSIEEEITHLNEEIRPDKDDDALLELIQERKALEAELLHVEQELQEPLPVQKVKKVKTEKVEPEVSAVPQPVALPEVEEVLVVEEHPEPRAPIFKEAGFGEEEIRINGLEESGEFEKYVHQLEASRESLGSFLQSLPRTARANKGFMLKVASMDPAYAMHYAVDALRQDESFHIEVASLKNSHGAGNALAEMDPAMRTGQVVLAGTRQDFRNVRFAQEDMPEYDEIVLVAKKEAIEKVKEFKEAVDMTMFLPKILQHDEAFMAEVQKIQQ